MNRRHLLLGSIATAFATPARAQGVKPRGLDAATFGVRANISDDQTQKLQRAIDEAARRNQPLWLGPGLYRTGELTLRAGTQLIGARDATRLALTRGPSLLSAQGAERVTLSGLTLDGGGVRMASNGGLVICNAVRDLRIADCTFLKSGSNGVSLTQCHGEIAGSTVTECADAALFCNDSRMTIRGNTISKSGNGGILVWQSTKRQDGSVIEANTIEDTFARGGGDGQNGNAINVYRAAGVTVRNNIIRRAAFTAVRGNAASHIHIVGNKCYALGEVAIYSEFEFEDATIADNLVDVAALGIAVTNFDKGGRGAIVRGNTVRNIVNKRPQGGPDSHGVGIGVEADTIVIGNTIENAPVMGIEAGSGKYLQNVTVTGNTIRKSDIGIGVSVAPGAGKAVISANIISGVKRGAIFGMEWDKVATGDLAKGGAERFPHLTISGNQVN